MSLSHSKHGVQRSGSRELIGKSHISSQTIRLGRQISSFHNEKRKSLTCSCVLAFIVREMVGPCLIWDRKHKRRVTMWEGTDATKYFNQATEISVHKIQYSVSSGWHPMENGQQWAWLVTNALFQDHPRRNTPQRACENVTSNIAWQSPRRLPQYRKMTHLYEYNGKVIKNRMCTSPTWR